MATTKRKAEPETETTTNVINVTNADGGSWFSAHVDFSFALSLTWIFGLTAGSALLCLGKPDLIDALVAALMR